MSSDNLEEINLWEEEATPFTQEHVENTDIKSRHRSKTENRPKKWNSFRKLPPDKDSDLVENQKYYLLFIKSVKVLAYVVTFTVVLCAAVITKSTTLLMISQLQPSRTIAYCNRTYEDRKFTATSSLEERLSWTWAIYFAFILPEIQTFFRSLRIWLFKGQAIPSIAEFIIPFVCETAHTIGLALLVYTVLPNMDAVKGAMLTNALCLIPGILGMLSRGIDETLWVLKCVMDVFAILFQLTALFVWPLFTPLNGEGSPWLLSVAAILVSFGWWENFVEPNSPFEIIQKLGQMKKRLRSTRYFTYTFIAIWKMGIFLLVMFFSVSLNEGSFNEGNFTVAIDRFKDAFYNSTWTVYETRPGLKDVVRPDTSTDYLLPASWKRNSTFVSVQYVTISQMVAAYICYVFAKFTCKISIQSFSFAFPILISVPVTIVTIIAVCGMRETKVCFWDSVMPGYLFWTCPHGDFVSEFLGKQQGWVWVLWILSQTWIAIHIWRPTGVRIAATETMFETPMYNSLVIDQSLALNYRRDDDDQEEVEIGSSSDVDPGYTKLSSTPNNTTTMNTISRNRKGLINPDTIPKICACATLWHEEREEMIGMLKSILRMDKDQCARRLAKRELELGYSTYYEFETHILFDDAFELTDIDDPRSPVTLNKYVKRFVKALEDAASHGRKHFVKLELPKKISTPYGGRLEWTLPGGTKLFVHLKNKKKIRAKKRWSQVMYMYYLLGYKIMESPISSARKDIIAEHTFILALDGDIDFQPNAVELLVDLMKKNTNLGAACGRIHPIGTGPMVWYQKFEYAVGHWLQKATEHVFGCVLCSPGCFSLFRAKALMADNVMAKYTTVSTEPIHCVQYDQGEDRWLCTLILQRGYRIEYCAASDAKTHAPEGFNEFYNQRRRWVPSTMANIMELLLNYKNVVKINPDISYLYIGYQIVMIVGTILGPGTIFLMLVGAFASAFNLGQWTSFLYNFIPIVLFCIVCHFCKSSIQLALARFLSVVYALAMVAVVVAIALQVSDDGLLAPSSIFLVSVASSFVIAALIHPKEWGCLAHGFLYYITIPSMYLLLMIYSLFNLNDVTWGTREGNTETERGAEEKQLQLQEAEEKIRAQALKNKTKGSFFGLLPKQKENEKDVKGNFEFSLAGLFRLMCCVQLAQIADALERVSKRLDVLERPVNNLPTDEMELGVTGKGGALTRHTSVTIDEQVQVVQGGTEGHLDIQTENHNLKDSQWINDEEVLEGVVDILTEEEFIFWEELIKEYLKPSYETNKEREDMKAGLNALKNSVAFSFLMMNAVFIVLVFLLQLEKESIHISWPFGQGTNVSYVPKSTEVDVTIEYLELEPIGLVFVVFFGVVLVTQFIGMCIHRFGTLIHILAATEIGWCSTQTSKTEETAKTNNKLESIKHLLHTRNSMAGDSDMDLKKGEGGRRQSLAELEEQLGEANEVENLEMNFRRHFMNSEDDGIPIFIQGDRIHRVQETITGLLERRSSAIIY